MSFNIFTALGYILFATYVNDIAYNLTIGHVLYADDVKLIAPQNTRDCPPMFLGRKFELVRVLGINSQPYESEHLPVGDVANPVTYALTFRTSPKIKPMLLKKPMEILLTLSDL